MERIVGHSFFVVFFIVSAHLANRFFFIKYMAAAVHLFVKLCTISRYGRGVIGFSIVGKMKLYQIFASCRVVISRYLVWKIEKHVAEMFVSGQRLRIRKQSLTRSYLDFAK